ncbi:MAG: hypothetical protein HFJ51_06635 [Clostridia bacterium]|nr:hypothetical protein [Clostridia bacterium]
MNPEMIEKLHSLLEQIPVTASNRPQIKHIKDLLDNKDFDAAVLELQNLKYSWSISEDENLPPKNSQTNDAFNTSDIEEYNSTYPKELIDEELEETYIGLLLSDPKAISRYYFLHDDCYFANDTITNLYRLVLFSDGEAYASELAKSGFTFAKNVEEIFPLKDDFKLKVRSKKYDFEKIYVELRKLFVLRKNYIRIPIKTIQDKIIDIINYDLYNKMSIEEVESAVSQAEVTSKFKQAVLNEDAFNFLTSGDNNLVNGLALPFPILSSVFKGIRRGEAMSFAMPSNAGKSRFTINLAAFIAFVHKKKVLVISNEMSEEKMKLCLITTVINNPQIQSLHGQSLKVSEGELLELKFRAYDGAHVDVDEDGYIIKKAGESQKDFIARLKKYSTDFNKLTIITDWLNKELNNSIYFINITDHTNDELNKVIKNYYYKEQIQYIFYDTLKADTDNIGNSDAIKRTATILSNLAQNFNIFIGSTMQLTENSTLPLNLTVNDLSASRTVKEVLDTLSLVKQIHNASLDQYEYSLNEVDTEFFDIEKSDDPNIRYYACVIDKNRAGSKPRLLFKINLAYNSWEELGYLRIK